MWSKSRVLEFIEQLARIDPGWQNPIDRDRESPFEHNKNEEEKQSPETLIRWRVLRIPTPAPPEFEFWKGNEDSTVIYNEKKLLLGARDLPGHTSVR